jgi:hypothetical protein
MSTICGFPTTMKDTTRAVSSCDFLLEARDEEEGTRIASASASAAVGSKSTKELVSSS